MKKFFLSLLILSPFLKIFAQTTLSVNQVTGDQAVFSGVKSGEKTLKYEDIQGSPFIDKTFYNANVAENYEKVPVRYNNYKDEIEFQKDGKIQVLPRDSKFSKIEIISPKKTFMLLNTGDDLSGYFMEVLKGENSLYKKNKIKFIDVVPAASSYATEKPASFKILDPIYYIKTINGFIKKPKNQKSIIEYFPDKKTQLESFFKTNKIKFDKEEDMIKLVNFLNTI